MVVYLPILFASDYICTAIQKCYRKSNKVTETAVDSFCHLNSSFNVNVMHECLEAEMQFYFSGKDSKGDKSNCISSWNFTNSEDSKQRRPNYKLKKSAAY